jgi:hypothetical protein
MSESARMIQLAIACSLTGSERDECARWQPRRVIQAPGLDQRKSGEAAAKLKTGAPHAEQKLRCVSPGLALRLTPR